MRPRRSSKSRWPAALTMQHSKMLTASLLAGVACAASTTEPPPPRSDPPCVIHVGEFPPTDCAFLVGQLADSNGRPLAGFAFRADSFAPGMGFSFASSSALSDAAGRVQLLVFRVDRFRPVAEPDTATVPLLLYLHLAEATALAPARTRTLVQLRFAPIGQIVDTSFIAVRFPIAVADLALVPRQGGPSLQVRRSSSGPPAQQ